MQTSGELLALFASVQERVKEITAGGHKLHIRQISALERDEYFAWVSANCSKDKWVGSSSYLSALALSTPDGTPLFANPGVDYLTVGKQLPGHVVEDIARQVMAYNVIGPKATDALAKN